MKMLTIPVVLGVGMLLGGTVLAEPPTPTDKGAASTTSAADVAEFDKQMKQAQENMDKMRTQMEQLRQAQDPQTRQKLLREHMATMQGTMGMMNGMWNTCMMGRSGGAMMGGPMMGHMMGGPMMGWHDMDDYYSSLTPEQMRQHQYMMDRYMGMQQMMMDHMMQNQKWMMAPPAK